MISDTEHKATKATVLIVDDNSDNLDILSGILKPFYKVKAAISGALALKIAQAKNMPDIILLDIMMPEIDGYEVCRQIKANPVTANIPVIFVTAKAEIDDEKIGFELGAVDYITKPVSAPIVLARVRAQLALYNQHLELEQLVKERTVELDNTRLEIVQRLGCAAEYKDNETGLHVIRMSWYAKFLAEQISANKAWVELIHTAAPMHDIGKIGIPDAIMLKPGKLTDEEFAEILEIQASKKFKKMKLDIGTKASQLDYSMEVLNDGNIAKALNGKANTMNTDLIIMGAKSKSLAAQLFLGNTTKKMIINDSTIPLLVIKNKKETFDFWDFFSKQ